MKLNCRPGDLAAIVRARFDPSQLGKIVTVIEWDPQTMGWIVEPPIVTDGSKWAAVCDSALRPIRPDEGDDETLDWAGKPEKVTA